MSYPTHQRRHELNAIERTLRQEDRLNAEKDEAYRNKDWPTFWRVKRELAELGRGDLNR